MDRREVIKNISLMTGAAFIGAEVFLQTGCKPKEGAISLAINDEDIITLDEIGETILPATDTPGAKSARIGSFMKMMVNDCYNNEEKTTFISGIKEIKEKFKAEYKVGFTEATKDQRKEFLKKIDKEAKEKNKTSPDQLPHFFTMMKQLTILGFFTSETGATQTLRYVAVPGRYDGAMPYKKGDKAWAV